MHRVVWERSCGPPSWLPRLSVAPGMRPCESDTTCRFRGWEARGVRARVSIPSDKERSMFFQVWRAGVKPHLLNISLRLIIIGGGCSAAAGRRRRWSSAILLTSRRLLRRRLASPVGPESRGKHPVSQIALDVVRWKPHTNGPHVGFFRRSLRVRGRQPSDPNTPHTPLGVGTQ